MAAAADFPAAVTAAVLGNKTPSDFRRAIIDGIILTKLDGTAKGGIAIAIRNELGLPVRYIGFGEQLDDMQPFDANQFADALFGK